ncbi:MAG: amylo-alpha-1,6-glucosidase [Bacillota bacterium]
MCQSWRCSSRSRGSWPPDSLWAASRSECTFILRRRSDGSTHVSIIHPWESGWDNSPRWDELTGFGDDDEQNKSIRAEMAARLKTIGFDSRGALEAAWFDVEPVDFNCIYAENLAALAWCADKIGHASEAKALADEAGKVKQAIRQKMKDPGTGSYLDIARVNGTERYVSVESPAAFFPLFAGIPTREEARALVDRLTSDSFWPRYPVPTVSRSDPKFTPDRYWRGTTWININWFILRGLLRYGFRDVAEDLVRRTAELVSTHGLWEYYNPLTGRGLGARDLSWGGLVIDMMSLVE